jgi:hypothetical protein
MKRVTTRLVYSLIGALVIMSGSPSRALAQDHQSHDFRPDWKNQNALVKVVRESTERFRDVSVAETEGYHLLFGCVSGGDFGAMGMHFANLPMVFDDVLDAARPEIVIYEPTSNGRLRLIGVDYLILAKTWDDKHPGTPPEIMGQLLHYFDAPNRFGLPPFYTLHVWAWKDNPTGTFVNWHSRVSCDGYAGPNR